MVSNIKSKAEYVNEVCYRFTDQETRETGKAKAVRFSTLEAICKILDCQPGDILEYREDE